MPIFAARRVQPPAINAATINMANVACFDMPSPPRWRQSAKVAPIVALLRPFQNSDAFFTGMSHGVALTRAKCGAVVIDGVAETRKGQVIATWPLHCWLPGPDSNQRPSG